MLRISRFRQVLEGLPRGQFDRTVERLGANKYSKGFGRWDQFVAMAYLQLSGASSLRTAVTGYNSQYAHHYHLDTAPLKRSTLADANSRRDPAVFAELAQQLMHQANRQIRQQGQALLYLLDASSITLKGLGFDGWTHGQRTRNTQGLKLHTLLHHGQQVPVAVAITAANVNDIDHGRTIPLQAGATYVFDKGYCDYNWWHRIDQHGAYFVTRFKRNAGLRLVEQRTVGNDPQVRADELVRFAHSHPRGGARNHYRQPLRRIVIARPDHASDLVLATNDLNSSAEQIAERYKQRWAIELFFKWIKQHLQIKRFIGRSENAVRTQLLVALITYLLVAVYHQASRFNGSLWECLFMLRTTLFQRPQTEAQLYRRRRRHAQIWAQCQPELFT